MPEWQFEDGIGERRGLLIEAEAVLAATLHWPGEMVAGEIRTATLARKLAGSRRGIVALDNGSQALVDLLPSQATEGLSGSVRLTRAPIAERGRLKRAQARWVENNPPPLSPASIAPAPNAATHRFASGVWEEVWHAASSGSIAFPGGEILCSVTPAMTVIDIDGDAPPRELALNAVPAIIKALRWFDLGGNVGIDFPTLEAKADRRKVDEALAQALADWPHERTAMNGFGFVQIVTRLKAPSLLHRFAASRIGMCARHAMRVAELAPGAGVTLLTVHPALRAKLKPEWIEELKRRTGRDLRIETNPGLALEAPSAQVVKV